MSGFRSEERKLEFCLAVSLSSLNRQTEKFCSQTPTVGRCVAVGASRCNFLPGFPSCVQMFHCSFFMRALCFFLPNSRPECSHVVLLDHSQGLGEALQCMGAERGNNRQNKRSWLIAGNYDEMKSQNLTLSIFVLFSSMNSQC